MQCTKCGFLVPSNLRFALMKNLCPSCGSELFSSKELNEINFFQGRISSQEFSKDFDELFTFDLALFILAEVKEAISRFNMEKAHKKDSEINIDSTIDGIDIAAIKRQVESDLEAEGHKIPLLPEEPIISEEDREAAEGVVFTAPSDDPRVAKLRTIAKQTKLGNKKGPAVRRVGDD